MSSGASLFDAIPEAQVAEALLPYLRRAGGAPAAEYAAAPQRILGGFDTLIYGFSVAGAGALEGDLVLRVYRDEKGPRRAAYESVVQNTVADLGFPAPRVLLTCVDRGVLGGAFVVMRRIRGEAMVHGFLRPGMHRLPAVMAKLQAQLHGLDPARLCASLSEAGFDPEEYSARAMLGRLRRQADAASLTGLDAALSWLERNQPPAARKVICHDDFHPLNVMMENGKVTGVLDWANIAIDDPHYDLGASVALLTLAPVSLPTILTPLINPVRRWLARRYLLAYGSLNRLDVGAVDYYEAFRCVGFLCEAGEKIQAAAGVIPPIPKPTAFGEPRIAAAIIARVRALTGIAVELPRR